MYLIGLGEIIVEKLEKKVILTADKHFGDILKYWKQNHFFRFSSYGKLTEIEIGIFNVFRKLETVFVFKIITFQSNQSIVLLTK